MNLHAAGGYLSAATGFAALAAATMGGIEPAIVRYFVAGAGIAMLALALFVWLESRGATISAALLAAALACASGSSLREPPNAALFALSLAEAALGATLAARRRRKSGIHPLDLPVYG